MGLHSSLKRAERTGKFRSVLTRTERIRLLIQRGLWEKLTSVYGLPKTKVARVKTSKKAKVKEEKKEESGKGASSS